MSTSVILECRNQDAKLIQANAPNGQWTTNLQEKVLLEEGDSIVCRNAFIDSRASNSQKIVIQEPLTLTFSFHRFLTNYYGAQNILNDTNNSVNVNTGTSTILPYNPVANSVVAQNDSANYVQCSESTLAVNTFSLPFIKFFGTNPFKGSGNFDIYLRYKNLSGVIVDQVETLEQIRNGDQMNISPLTAGNIEYDNSATTIPGNGGKPIRAFLAGTDGAAVPGNINLAYGPIDGVPDGKGFRSVVPHGADGLGVTVLPPIDYGVALQGRTFTPVPGTATVQLDSGNYEPEEICEVFNRQFDQITGGEAQFTRAGSNQFLQQVGGGAPGETGNNFVQMMDRTATDHYGYTINDGDAFSQFVGANQVVLDYDDATQKFFFEFLHFPAYTSSNVEGTVTIVRPINPGEYTEYKNPDMFSGVRISVANKNGGIYFTKLSAKETISQKPQNGFFSEVLGFDTALVNKDGSHNDNCIVSRVTPATLNESGASFTVNGIQSSIPTYVTPPTDGKQTVGAFVGLDTVVNKSSGKDDGTSARPLPLTPTTIENVGATGSQKNSFAGATSDKTTPINAKSSLLAGSAKLTFGYYLVEVGAQFQNQFITPDENKGNVVSIVSRYYEKDAFTSASSSDSVIYQHKGVPQLLSSFRCRILDSSKELATNIGSDNTIFLEIIKAPPKEKK